MGCTLYLHSSCLGLPLRVHPISFGKAAAGRPSPARPRGGPTPGREPREPSRRQALVPKAAPEGGAIARISPLDHRQRGQARRDTLKCVSPAPETPYLVTETAFEWFKKPRTRFAPRIGWSPDPEFCRPSCDSCLSSIIALIDRHFSIGAQMWSLLAVPFQVGSGVILCSGRHVYSQPYRGRSMLAWRVPFATPETPHWVDTRECAIRLELPFTHFFSLSIHDMNNRNFCLWEFIPLLRGLRN